ncbi:SDR family NAD(P)-dependent oxidoreductase [Caldithrix abyssi]|uniref:NAD(P)-dependent dehydrogenase, short-chain alcohol dehydrogenase family n=1 Tax=Caldithrix abyssi DSM 13497 TaxID=880073 RepID=H1XVE2_CALAY|nr:SDR family oxidoreductase [Caldithrix abyssi]APF17612.1 NAD(P)-dependent dehydrogenase, short-chain alcohol dehydrogenase family [Caldithrix abyssi DSM 13497]EHO41700.1 short-chain dehydrogenase/reductase SDR [Caldithrix abyssi DSM 13497]
MAYVKPNPETDYAFILGVSSGFGEATALELAREGFNIIGVHMDRGEALNHVEELKRLIKENGVEAIFFNKNAASEKNRKQVIDEIKAHFGQSENKKQIKVMLHSLAFGSLAPYIHHDLDERLTQKQLEMTINVMANSLVYWTQDLVEEHLLGQGSKIFAMTSSGSLRVIPYYGAVSAAKSALESHVRQLALELAPYKMTVNAIRAGVTFTPALRKIPGHETMIDLALSQIPFKRLTQPSDIAKFILALATSDELWATGNVFNVDGGEVITAYHSTFHHKR